MTFHHLMLFLHLLGVVVWVGGMFFAYMCLRPAAVSLPPPLRLSLWAGVFARFFPLVWVAVLLIAGSGLHILLESASGRAPTAWHVMLLTGAVMIAVFLSIWFGPWRRLQLAVKADDWAAGAIALNQIRQRVGVNLSIGILTVAIATLGLGV